MTKDRIAENKFFVLVFTVKKTWAEFHDEILILGGLCKGYL